MIWPRYRRTTVLRIGFSGVREVLPHLGSVSEGINRMLKWIEQPYAETAHGGDAGLSRDGMLITGQSGLASGTHVASNLGWREVQKLSVGDKVLTFDHGMQTIVDIQRERIPVPEMALPDTRLPVWVPEGALHNRTDLWLMPDQGLLVESEAAIDVLGDPFAVVQAKALAGFRGIQPLVPRLAIDITMLSFAQDEVVYVEGGMLAHCPRPRQILLDRAEPGAQLYEVLDLRAARFLVECLIEDDCASGFICNPEELAVMAQVA